MYWDPNVHTAPMYTQHQCTHSTNVHTAPMTVCYVGLKTTDSFGCCRWRSCLCRLAGTVRHNLSCHFVPKVIEFIGCKKLAGWLNVLLIEWLVTDWPTWLTYCLTSWLNGWLTGWISDWLVDWRAEGLWLLGWLVAWLTLWLNEWLTGWLTVWMNEWLTGWLTVSTNEWLTGWLPLEE